MFKMKIQALNYSPGHRKGLLFKKLFHNINNKYILVHLVINQFKLSLS